MDISCDFDGGNIVVLEAARPDAIRLEIRKDNNSDFYQWFYFALDGAAGQPCALRIENAGGAAYTGGWQEYRAVASYDNQSWFRVDADYDDGGVLTIRHTPEHDRVFYSYFAPYPLERHQALVARIAASPLVSHKVLGSTLDGRDLDLLEVGAEKDAALSCWIFARQHPGETMAEWWMEGFLDRLIDPGDAAAQVALAACTFYVVPNMNPDGSARGHLRTNAAGANLNREWKEPSLARSPEVYLVRAAMEQTGVDFAFDVHGDEALPYNFIAGFSGIPSVTERQLRLLETFKATLKEISPDFQTQHGYPPTPKGEATLKMATDYLAETFGCLAMTLEMPFKDNAERPDPEHGWSPERCRALGHDCLEALARMVPLLRDKS